jgi:hypothetical protein
MKRIALLGVVVSCFAITACNNTPPAPTPAPPPAPTVPTVPNISGTYTGGLNFLTCFPGQFAPVTLTLIQDSTTSVANDYFGTLKTEFATLNVTAVNDPSDINKFTVFTLAGQGGFAEFKVKHSSSGLLTGSFSVLVNPGTCQDSPIAAEATGTVTFVP